jgi:hypothetical protein
MKTRVAKPQSFTQAIKRTPLAQRAGKGPSMRALIIVGAVAILSTISSHAFAGDYGLQVVSGFYWARSNGTSYACANIGSFKWCVPTTDPGAPMFMDVVANATQQAHKVNVGCTNPCTSTLVLGAVAWLPDYVTQLPF